MLDFEKPGPHPQPFSPVLYLNARVVYIILKEKTYGRPYSLQHEEDSVDLQEVYAFPNERWAEYQPVHQEPAA